MYVPSSGPAWGSPFPTTLDDLRVVIDVPDPHDSADVLLAAYSNKDYAAKRGRAGQESPRCYLNTSALAQERELASQFTVWTPAEIEKRRQSIDEWALQRWGVAAPSPP